MNAQVRLDALMLALRSSDYWVTGWANIAGTEHGLLLYENQAGLVGDKLIAQFNGTQDEILDQLIAYQVAERLS